MIDFHCHLDLYPEPSRVISAADRAGIYVLSVTTTPKAWRKTSSLASNAKRIRTALGLHPQLAHERLSELPLFEALLPEAKYVGEIGLDGSAEWRAHAGAQRQAFETILRLCARNGGRVLSIHSRGAADEVLGCLRSEPDAGVAIFHWFSGSAAQLRRAIDQNCWFSVGPAMLRSAKGRAITSAMPRDRLVTETDGPFATEGNRCLEPTDSWQAVRSLANIWQTPESDVVSALTENLRRLGSH